MKNWGIEPQNLPGAATPTPPPVATQGDTIQVLVTLPDGVQGGQTLRAKLPDGREVLVTVPPGAQPGAQLQVQVPAQPTGDTSGDAELARQLQSELDLEAGVGPGSVPSEGENLKMNEQVFINTLNEIRTRIQELGETCMKTPPPDWRYTRGQRDLPSLTQVVIKEDAKAGDVEGLNAPPQKIITQVPTPTPQTDSEEDSAEDQPVALVPSPLELPQEKDEKKAAEEGSAEGQPVDPVPPPGSSTRPKAEAKDPAAEEGGQPSSQEKGRGKPQGRLPPLKGAQVIPLSGRPGDIYE